MLATITLPAINHLLSQQDWARRRLAAHGGTSLRLSAQPVLLRCTIDEHGLLSAADEKEDDDVVIELPFEALSSLPNGTDALMAQVRITGNADVADTLSFVFRHLRWDREADLARLFGPILGRRLHLGARQCERAIPEISRRLAGNVGEYLVHEGALLVAKETMEAHVTDLRHLRDDLARLEQRVARLSTPGKR